MKGGFLAGEVEKLQGRTTANWTVENGFHFGGFAKTTPALTAFVDDFRSRHGIELNRVYEAKMMYGLLALVGQGRFPPGTTVLALNA